MGIGGKAWAECQSPETTKLPHANGLTALEKRLAVAQNYLATYLPGTQQVRKLMYHSQFGARVVYGDCIFFTISPNEQHSALVLRLSRFRQNDPYCLWSDELTRKLAREDFPLLEGKRAKPGASVKHEEDIEHVDIELPEYDLRRVATARNPRAVVEGYRVEVFLRLATILGV